MPPAIQLKNWAGVSMQLTRVCNSMTTQRRVLFALIGVSLLAMLYMLATHLGEFGSQKSNCTGYFELGEVQFLDDGVRGRLCQNATAYTIVKGRFPLCQLTSRLPDSIEKEVSRAVAKGYVISKVTGHNVTVMGYSGSDLISMEIGRYHAWEPILVTRLIKIALSLPQGEVTFLDIGSNIGVYSLQAVDAGLPTVAVDANIRNLVRMQLSARDMRWPSDRLRMFWAFFDTRVSLRYLRFDTSGCNIGGAGSGSDGGSFVTDSVPVMTAMGNDLLPHLRTRLIVMKIDIEASERIFFETGRQLLEDKQIAVVQMEWWRPSARSPASTSPNHEYLINYFVSRNYVLLSPTDLRQLDPATFREWDTLWVRRDFLETVRKTTMDD